MSIDVDPDWWKTLFDDIYLVTDSRSVCDDRVTRREVDVYCDFIPIESEDRVLDLCGGQGRHSLELCRRGLGRCSVLDYSSRLIDIGSGLAAREGYTIDYSQGDARALKFENRSFDHVLILGNSLGYIPDETADLTIFQESLRVLKSGGWLAVDVTDGNVVKQKFAPNAWHEIGEDMVVCRQRELQGNRICAREMVLNKKTGLVRDRNYCIRLYSSDHLASLVKQTGFSAVQVHTDFSPYQREGDVGFMNHRMIVTGRKP